MSAGMGGEFLFIHFHHRALDGGGSNFRHAGAGGKNWSAQAVSIRVGFAQAGGIPVAGKAGGINHRRGRCGVFAPLVQPIAEQFCRHFADAAALLRNWPGRVGELFGI